MYRLVKITVEHRLYVEMKEGFEWEKLYFCMNIFQLISLVNDNK